MKQIIIMILLLFINVQDNWATTLLSANNEETKTEVSSETPRVGTASFYHPKFVGRKTATGEIFSNNDYTCASNHYKLGTYLKVTNISNKKIVYVRVNDRMGHPTRIIDLTHKSAKDLNFINSGTAKVKIEIVAEQEGKGKIFAQKQGINNDLKPNEL